MTSLRLQGEDCPMWMVSAGVDGYVSPRGLTHECPDSFERIADELDRWKREAAESYKIVSDDEDTLHYLTERIRKLAKERNHE